MNRQQAAKRGYGYTGIAGRHKEEVMVRLDGIRNQGYKAVLVYEPPSPLARGYSGGTHSVYAERKYFIDKEKGEIGNKISRFPARKALMASEYQKELAELDAEYADLTRRLTELESKNPLTKTERAEERSIIVRLKKLRNPSNYTKMKDKAGTSWGVMPFGGEGLVLGREDNKAIKYVTSHYPGMKTVTVQNPRRKRRSKSTLVPVLGVAALAAIIYLAIKK